MDWNELPELVRDRIIFFLDERHLRLVCRHFHRQLLLNNTQDHAYIKRRVALEMGEMPVCYQAVTWTRPYNAIEVSIRLLVVPGTHFGMNYIFESQPPLFGKAPYRYDKIWATFTRDVGHYKEYEFAAWLYTPGQAQFSFWWLCGGTDAKSPINEQYREDCTETYIESIG